MFFNFLDILPGTSVNYILSSRLIFRPSIPKNLDPDAPPKQIAEEVRRELKADWVGLIQVPQLHALAELTPQQRLMFLLKHREGMTYQEIASTFGCSAGSVKKSLFRAVLKLRESLGVGGGRAECVAAAAEEV